MFTASVGQGAIGLDEIDIGLEACPQTNLCDFESGPCNWTSTTGTNQDYMFKLISASDSAWSTRI